jgi:hypothetical protein
VCVPLRPFRLHYRLDKLPIIFDFKRAAKKMSVSPTTRIGLSRRSGRTLAPQSSRRRSPDQRAADRFLAAMENTPTQSQSQSRHRVRVRSVRPDDHTLAQNENAAGRTCKDDSQRRHHPKLIREPEVGERDPITLGDVTDIPVERRVGLGDHHSSITDIGVLREWVFTRGVGECPVTRTPLPPRVLNWVMEPVEPSEHGDDAVSGTLRTMELSWLRERSEAELEMFLENERMNNANELEWQQGLRLPPSFPVTTSGLSAEDNGNDSVNFNIDIDGSNHHANDRRVDYHAQGGLFLSVAIMATEMDTMSLTQATIDIANDIALKYSGPEPDTPGSALPCAVDETSFGGMDTVDGFLVRVHNHVVSFIETVLANNRGVLRSSVSGGNLRVGFECASGPPIVTSIERGTFTMDIHPTSFVSGQDRRNRIVLYDQRFEQPF